MLVEINDLGGEPHRQTLNRPKLGTHATRRVADHSRPTTHHSLRRPARTGSAATGPVSILLPLQGVSQLDSPGGMFWDPEADGACFAAIKTNLQPGIPVIEINCNINDPEFADLWPAALNMPPSWVVWSIFAAVRFRLLEISVPPGAATLEKLAALAPAAGDTMVRWARSMSHWVTEATKGP